MQGRLLFFNIVLLICVVELNHVITDCSLDPDLDLLLRSCMPLLQSRNTAVNINCLLVVKYEGLYAYGLIMNIVTHDLVIK